MMTFGGRMLGWPVTKCMDICHMGDSDIGLGPLRKRLGDCAKFCFSS